MFILMETESEIERLGDSVFVCVRARLLARTIKKEIRYWER